MFDAKPRSGPPQSAGGSSGGSYAAFIARCKRGGYAGGPKRAAFWRALGFLNLVRARATLANQVRLRRLEQWKQEELRRTPFAILDEPPPELAPVKRTRFGPLSRNT
jgi:hypothetical protein